MGLGKWLIVLMNLNLWDVNGFQKENES